MMSKFIPEGWSTNRLGEIAEIAIGGTPARKEIKYWDPEKETDNHWVAISDLKARYIFETEERISVLGVKNSNAKLVPAETLLMSFKLTIGRVAVNKVPVYTNEAIAAFHLKNGAVDRDFLYYTLPVVCQGVESDQAVKGKTLNKEKLNRIKLLLPPLNEQKKISEILGSVDQAIDATQQVIGQTRQVKRALMQELLTRGIPGQHTPLGEIPEDWEVIKIRDICNVVRGSTPRPAKDPRYFNGSFIPWVTVGEITKDEYVYVENTSTMLTEEGAKRSRIIHKGTLLLTNSGFSLGVPKITLIDVCINDGIAAFLDLNSKVIPEYLYWFLTTMTKKFRKSISRGVEQINLNTTIIGEIEFPLPSKGEQEKITQIFTSIEQDINAKEACLERLEQLKVGLMQVLLTGEKRVVVADQQDKLLEVAV